MRYFLIILLVIFSGSLFSQEAEVWFAKAHQSFLKGNLDEAIDYASKAIGKDSSHKDSYYTRGLALLYQNKFEQCIPDFNKVIELDTNFADAYNNRGLALSIVGEAELSMGDFNRAISLDSNFEQAYINRGSAYVSIQNYQAALQDFAKAISINDKNPETYYQQARALYFTKKFEDAVQNFTKSIELGLTNTKAYYSRANAYYQNGQYDKAIADYSKALEEEPDNTEILNNRAVAYDKIGETEKAAADRQKINTINGTSNQFPDVETLKFTKYSDKGQILSIDLPENWFSFENSDTNQVDLIITPDNNQEKFTVGVQMSIVWNMEKMYGVRDPQALIEFWRGSNMQNTQNFAVYEIFKQKTINIGPYSGVIHTTKIQAQKNFIPFKLYELVVAKDDVLFFGYFQCPEVQFEYYQKIFDKAIKTLSIK